MKTASTHRLIKASGGWVELPPNTYRCVAHFRAEREGGFSIVSATLPGAASQGDTLPEALGNFKEAMHAVIDSYQADGVPIPWAPEEKLRRGWLRATVFVVVPPGEVL